MYKKYSTKWNQPVLVAAVNVKATNPVANTKKIVGVVCCCCCCCHSVKKRSFPHCWGPARCDESCFILSSPSYDLAVLERNRDKYVLPMCARGEIGPRHGILAAGLRKWSVPNSQYRWNVVVAWPRSSTGVCAPPPCGAAHYGTLSPTSNGNGSSIIRQ